MSAPNPSVSVFHFTHRISSAKIRKYKLATERGMSSGNANGRASTPISNGTEQALSHSAESPTMEPPAKRPKLKLSVRPPATSPDTIAVSRPKRESSLRIRYSENMIIDAADVDDMAVEPKPKPSPAASSDLSSRPARGSMEKEPTPAKAPTPPPSKTRDYSRDFMSYYVADGDEEDEKDDPPEPERPPKKAEPPKPAPAPPIPEKPRRQPQKQAQFEHHVQPPTYPKPRIQPSRPPPLPQPTVYLIDTIKKPSKPREPTTVAGMISRLEGLSAALKSFGASTVPKSSNETSGGEAPNQQPATAKKDVDNFLAMFDDDDDDSDAKDETNDEGSNSLDHQLQNPGEADDALIYGIQFIQNALRSWAHQRLSSQYTAHYLQYQQHVRDAAVHSHKRGPGRPRKFELGDEELQSLPPPPLNIQYDLAKTPEGNAIAAFQEVLDSGCLRVNAILPVALTRALRHLYMQIDHLINQGSRNEPPWQCMSYGAQIAAQKVRVEQWKEAHAKAQEEMARQQHLAQQQVMERMGIKPHHRTQLTAEQAQQQHAIDLERKRNLQHAAQQPHLTKYLTNPLKLDAQPGNVPTDVTVSNAPMYGAVASSPRVNNEPGASAIPSGGASLHSSPVDGRVQLDKIKLYMPNYLPRSGQSMKFSFAPTSELALQAFGAQAFPTNHAGPNLPNRGPMSANPHLASGHAHMPNGTKPVSQLPSNAALSAPAKLKQEPVKIPGSTSNPNKAGLTSVPTTLKEARHSGPSFTAVNGTSAPQRSITVPTSSAKAVSPDNRPLVSGSADSSPEVTPSLDLPGWPSGIPVSFVMPHPVPPGEDG